MTKERILFRARNLPEAWLLRERLQEAGVRVRLAGEALVGLAGAIPLRDAEPILWVPEEQVARAQGVLDRFFGPELVHPARRCPSCEEDNPAGFQICWNCETPLE